MLLCSIISILLSITSLIHCPLFTSSLTTHYSSQVTLPLPAMAPKKNMTTPMKSAASARPRRGRSASSKPDDVLDPAPASVRKSTRTTRNSYKEDPNGSPLLHGLDKVTRHIRSTRRGTRTPSRATKSPLSDHQPTDVDMGHDVSTALRQPSSAPDDDADAQVQLQIEHDMQDSIAAQQESDSQQEPSSSADVMDTAESDVMPTSSGPSDLASIQESSAQEIVTEETITHGITTQHITDQDIAIQGITTQDTTTQETATQNTTLHSITQNTASTQDFIEIDSSEDDGNSHMADDVEGDDTIQAHKIHPTIETASSIDRNDSPESIDSYMTDAHADDDEEGEDVDDTDFGEASPDLEEQEDVDDVQSNEPSPNPEDQVPALDMRGDVIEPPGIETIQNDAIDLTGDDDDPTPRASPARSIRQEEVPEQQPTKAVADDPVTTSNVITATRIGEDYNFTLPPTLDTTQPHQTSPSRAISHTQPQVFLQAQQEKVQQQQQHVNPKEKEIEDLRHQLKRAEEERDTIKEQCVDLQDDITFLYAGLKGVRRERAHDKAKYEKDKAEYQKAYQKLANIAAQYAADNISLGRRFQELLPQEYVENLEATANKLQSQIIDEGLEDMKSASASTNLTPARKNMRVKGGNITANARAFAKATPARKNTQVEGNNITANSNASNKGHTAGYMPSYYQNPMLDLIKQDAWLVKQQQEAQGHVGPRSFERPTTLEDAVDMIPVGGVSYDPREAYQINAKAKRDAGTNDLTERELAEETRMRLEQANEERTENLGSTPGSYHAAHNIIAPSTNVSLCHLMLTSFWDSLIHSQDVQPQPTTPTPTPSSWLPSLSRISSFLGRIAHSPSKSTTNTKETEHSADPADSASLSPPVTFTPPNQQPVWHGESPLDTSMPDISPSSSSNIPPEQRQKLAPNPRPEYKQAFVEQVRQGATDLSMIDEETSSMLRADATSTAQPAPVIDVELSPRGITTPLNKTGQASKRQMLRTTRKEKDLRKEKDVHQGARIKGRNSQSREVEQEEEANDEIQQAQTGQKRKRTHKVKFDQIASIPNPVGCSYGYDAAYFPGDSDSEAEWDDDQIERARGAQRPEDRAAFEIAVGNTPKAVVRGPMFGGDPTREQREVLSGFLYSPNRYASYPHPAQPDWRHVHDPPTMPHVAVGTGGNNVFANSAQAEQLRKTGHVPGDGTHGASFGVPEMSDDEDVTEVDIDQTTLSTWSESDIIASTPAHDPAEARLAAAREAANKHKPAQPSRLREAASAAPESGSEDEAVGPATPPASAGFDFLGMEVEGEYPVNPRFAEYMETYEGGQKALRLLELAGLPL